MPLGGTSISEGVALGHVVLHEPRIVVTRLIAEDVEVERRRLSQAIEDLTGAIDNMLERGDRRAGEHREVLELPHVRSRSWLARRLDEALLTGLTAEAAVRVRNDTRARMLRMPDTHARDRLHDIDDLSNRLLRLLAGGIGTAATALPQDLIVIARTMGAAELLDYDRQCLRGLVLEEGGTASHVAIVARALGIAALTGVKGRLEAVEPGDAAIVDAEGASCMSGRPRKSFRPMPTRFASALGVRRNTRPCAPSPCHPGRRARRLAHQCRPPLRLAASQSVGRGRHRPVPHRAPIHDRGDVPAARAADPTLQAILDAADQRPVVFRSLDVGGDKVLPYFRGAIEDNPALGWRAIRMALDRPAVFRTQVRAPRGGGQPRASPSCCP